MKVFTSVTVFIKKEREVLLLILIVPKRGDHLFQVSTNLGCDLYGYSTEKLNSWAFVAVHSLHGETAYKVY